MDTKQTDFWSAHPCGVAGDYTERRSQRYRMEPWLPFYLAEIAPDTPIDCLEVGCGQGTDALELCQLLAPGSTYEGLDFSSESIAVANATMETEAEQIGLATRPHFAVGDALDLQFPNDRFDMVYSLGVLHHTPDPMRAIAEVRRVLKPGGTAHIFLYRTFSLKVGGAKILRGAQRASDILTGRERCIYAAFLENRPPSRFLGTMLHECFGVPFMYSYTRGQVARLFHSFESVSIDPFGFNVILHGQPYGRNPFGYFWRIIATT